MKLPYLLLLLMVPMVTWANPAEQGSITYLVVHQHPDNSIAAHQKFEVKLSPNTNICGEDTIWVGYFDTDAGKAQYSTLLALSIAGREAVIHGSDPVNCDGSRLRIRNVFAKK